MKITCKLIFDKIDGIKLVPSNYYDEKRIHWEYNDGDFLLCNIRKGRTYKRLGEYWLIMTGIAFQFGGSKEHWHTEFKREILGSETVKNIITGENQTVVPSVSFESMQSEEDFENYLTNVKKILTEKGIDWQELINNLPNKKEKL